MSMMSTKDTLNHKHNVRSMSAGSLLSVKSSDRANHQKTSIKNTFKTIEKKKVNFKDNLSNIDLDLNSNYSINININTNPHLQNNNNNIEKK